jgi:3-hydroxyisobutyrate dehydrogenase
MAKETSLGFVGLGLMGLPMARRLLAAGHRLTVWNRSPDKAQVAHEAGAELAGSPCAAADAAQIVFTCVTDTAAMEAIVFGTGGIAEADGRGKLLIDHSSIYPAATRDFANRLLERNGMSWMDAPVSGGVAGAEAGTLAIMAGGSAEDFKRAEPFLAELSQRLRHLGPVGAGQTAKLCNQVIVGCAFPVIAEALRLAENSGLDAHALIDAMTDGFADSKPLQIFGPRMLETVENPVARIGVVLKDVDTALDVARQSETPMPMTATAGELYRTLVARGFGSAEFDVLFRSLGRAGENDGA